MWGRVCGLLGLEEWAGEVDSGLLWGNVEATRKLLITCSRGAGWADAAAAAGPGSAGFDAAWGALRSKVGGSGVEKQTVGVLAALLVVLALSVALRCPSTRESVFLFIDTSLGFSKSPKPPFFSADALLVV